MPQMAPMWWTFLMITFLMSFSLMMSLLYFNILSKSMMVKKTKINQMNWKW
uniref:ATP synthase F0 subunit 8 n=1 Tax=Atkinsoniella uniguttata TaxID=2930060 RepID=UPI002000BBF9|nr:ATP synthase F0 subunit 8 [Atkinsoniella uniguttata]UNZ12629.1 ATP synthase F0 subunit 8 [Atkinsoniella uniguttata]